MKVMRNSVNQSGRVMLRWRKAGLDLAALSSIPRSSFIDAPRKQKARFHTFGKLNSFKFYSKSTQSREWYIVD